MRLDRPNRQQPHWPGLKRVGCFLPCKIGQYGDGLMLHDVKPPTRTDVRTVTTTPVIAVDG
jgi:hypothetical protein